MAYYGIFYNAYQQVVRNLTLKDTFYNLYLGKTNGIPKDENGKEFEVMYCLENDKEISTNLEKKFKFEIFFNCIAKN